MTRGPRHGQQVLDLAVRYSLDHAMNTMLARRSMAAASAVVSLNHSLARASLPTLRVSVSTGKGTLAHLRAAMGDLAIQYAVMASPKKKHERTRVRCCRRCLDPAPAHGKRE